MIIEAFVLDRPVVPAVQRILRLQSNPLNSLILRQARPDATLLDSVRQATSEYIPASSLAHQSTELIEAGLLVRSSRGRVGPSKVGEVAISALEEYRVALLAPLYKARIEVLRGQLGDEFADTFVQGLIPEKAPFPPILFKIMAIQGDVSKMGTLLSIPRSQADSAGAGEVRRYAIQTAGKEIPPSTFSNLVRQLKDKDLVTGSGRKGLNLSSLGETSLSAYNTYQETLYPVLVEDYVDRALKDLGIRPSETS